MKAIFTVLVLFLSFSAQAAREKQANCKDANLNGLDVGIKYDELKYHNRFTQLLATPSAAPAGFEEFDWDGNTLCRATSATYLKHKATNKLYIMFTTGDDYCDGGNTLGIMIDQNKYEFGGENVRDSIVAHIGDSEFVCEKNQ
jgi:hypothetical protein